MASGLLCILLVLSSTNSWMLVGGQTCSLSAGQFSLSTVTVTAENVRGFSTPAARVTWSTTVPPQCVTSVRVEFRISTQGDVVTTNTTNDTSETEIIQTGLQCDTNYYITVVVTGATSDGGRFTPNGVQVTLNSRQVQMLTDIPQPLGLRAEATADNTSITVSWQWSRQGLFTCVDLVRVDYQLEGGSLMMYTVNNTTATSATLSKDLAVIEATLTGLHCNTNYTITVATSSGVYRRNMTGTVHLPLQDIPTPVGVRAEATTDNTSIRVSWGWSHQGVPMCVDLVRVHYLPEEGSPTMYTVGSTTVSTGATLPNLQCNKVYSIWVYARGGLNDARSTPRMIYLPARAPPTPTGVTAWFANPSTVRVTWQWTSSGPAPDCFNTTTVTYRPEGGDESSLQLSDPLATEATLTDLQCNTSYTITVVATAGVHRSEGVTFPPLQGPRSLSAAVLSPTSVRLTWMAHCDTQKYHIYYRGTCGTYVHKGSLDANHREHTVDGLQEDITYTFTVNQTGFSGSRVFSTGPVYARTFTAVPSGAPQSLEAAWFVRPPKVFLRWREVPCVQQNGPITGYVVRYYATCGTGRDVKQDKSVVTAGDTIDGLTPNTEYAFQVAAVNLDGTGPFSEPIILGGTPQLVMVILVNSTTVTVSWSEVQCFNGSGAVTHYLVQYQSMCGGAVLTVETGGPVHETTVSGLTPNASLYTFQVAAVHVQTTGPFSNFVVLSPGTPPTCPMEDCRQATTVPSNETTAPADETAAPADETTGPVNCQEVWTVTGVAAVLVLIVFILMVVVVVVQCTIIWSRRSTSKTTSESQSVSLTSPKQTEGITEITMKECLAYGEVGNDGDQRVEPQVYEIP